MYHIVSHGRQFLVHIMAWRFAVSIYIWITAHIDFHLTKCSQSRPRTAHGIVGVIVTASCGWTRCNIVRVSLVRTHRLLCVIKCIVAPTVPIADAALYRMLYCDIVLSSDQIVTVIQSSDSQRRSQSQSVFNSTDIDSEISINKNVSYFIIFNERLLYHTDL